MLVNIEMLSVAICYINY